MKKILVTGANGFIGNSLLLRLAEVIRYSVVAAVRHPLARKPEKVEILETNEIGPDTDWSKTLKNVKVIIHTAARVHIMKDNSPDPLSDYRKVNTAGTLNLARQASSAGVRRFIFLSSVKVNGEQTFGTPFKPDDKENPEDPYGVSKYEAEKGLKKIAKETGMEIVIIRCPLVYGPGVKGNFQTMMKWVKYGLPLPLGKIKNKRSMIGLENLIDFIIDCIDHPKAANEIFLISDGEEVSTSELLQKMAKAIDKRILLLPVSEKLFKFVTKLTGLSGIYSRLFGNLEIDSSKTRKLLGWKPVLNMDQQLKKMVQE